MPRFKAAPSGAKATSVMSGLLQTFDDNHLLLARSILALSRVLIFGKLLADPSQRKAKYLSVEDLERGLRHHSDGLRRTGVDREHILACLRHLSRLCEEDSRVAACFYIRRTDERIRCRVHRGSRPSGRETAVPLGSHILTSLFEDSWCRAALLNFVAKDIQQHYDLFADNTDPLHEFRQLAGVFNRFAEEESRSIPYESLVAHMVNRTELRREAVDAFIEWLLVKRVLRQHSYDRHMLYRAGFSDTGFIRNTLFGISTGVDGLDYLFEGALLAPPRAPLSMVIDGDKGTGKSSLALTYATAWASCGGLVGYAALEQDVDGLYKTLQDWSLTDQPTFHVFSTEASVDSIEDCLRDQRGAILLGCPGHSLSFEELRDKLEASMRRSLWMRFPLRLMVVDPVNALKNYRDEETWRSDLAEFTEVTRRQGFSTMLVTETGNSEGHMLEAFVAETVVSLSYRGYHETHSDVLKYKYRSLEIQKARQQHTCRGQHLLRLRVGHGLRVYPSSGAILATMKRPSRIPVDDRTQPIPSPGVLGILIGGFDSLSDSASSTWMTPNTCTSIIGEGGTHKTAFARLFSKAVLYKSRGTEGTGSTPKLTPSRGRASLLVLFGHRFTPSAPRPDTGRREYVREVDVGEHCRCYEVTPVDPQTPGNWSRELVLEFPSGYQTGSHVLADIVESLEYLQRQHCDPACAVIDDLDSMETEHPVLAADEFFLPCLVQRLESDIISVFLVNRLPRGAFDKSDRKVASLSQNEIRLTHVYEPGADRTAMYVSKSLNGHHNNDVLELVPMESGLAEFQVRDTFRRYRNLRHGGKPERIGLKILFSGETALQNTYHNQLKTVHDWVETSAKVHTVTPVFDLHRRLLSSQLVSTSGDVVVVACDNPDLPELVEAGCFENLRELLDDAMLDKIQKAFGPEATRDNLFGTDGPFLKSISSHMPKGPKPYTEYQLPYYVNLAVLVCSGALRRTIEQDYGEEPTYTWENLLELAKREAAKHKGPVRLFDCMALHPQTYFCHFLEVFSSLLDERPIPKDDGCLHFCDSLVSHLDEAVKALRLLYRLSRVANSSSASCSTSPKERLPSVFRRHWYSTFRAEVAKRIEKMDEELDVAVLPLPGYSSVIGDWHLCVVSGSSSPKLGAECIVDLCANDMAIERQACGVGLPPAKRFYCCESDLPFSNLPMSQFEEIHKQGISRCAIRCYRSISLLLGNCIQGFLRRPEAMVKEEHCKAFIESLRSLFPRDKCPAVVEEPCGDNDKSEASAGTPLCQND